MVAVSRSAAKRADVQERLSEAGSYQRWVLLTALAGMFATTFPVTLLTVSLSTIATTSAPPRRWWPG